jgi:hypothetical protein
MASKRELIAQNIVSTLKNQTTYRFGLVTREPQRDIEDLAKTSFPCAVIESANETREDISQGGTDITRMSDAEYSIMVYVMSGRRDLDTQRNEIIQAVEELLDADRTRGGNALFTELIAVESDDGAQSPIVSMRLTVLVRYCYTRGNV